MHFSNSSSASVDGVCFDKGLDFQVGPVLSTWTAEEREESQSFTSQGWLLYVDMKYCKILYLCELYSQYQIGN